MEKVYWEGIYNNICICMQYAVSNRKGNMVCSTSEGYNKNWPWETFDGFTYSVHTWQSLV